VIELKYNFTSNGLIQEVKRKHEIELKKAIEEVRLEIIERTLQQRDAYGASFKRLTTKYKAYKIGLGLPGVPNLKLTGKMLGSLYTKVETIGKDLVGYITFRSKKEAAKAEGNANNGRDFLRLSDKQADKISKKLEG
jgi:hypothetical protein